MPTKRSADAREGRVGRPPVPASALAKSPRGTITARVLLPAATVAQLDRLAAARGMRGRNVLAGQMALAGFAALEAHPPKRHEPPGGAMRGADDAGVKVELKPAELQRIERYAEARALGRNLVLALAIVRGLKEGA
jgi:hypothetical protein